MIDIIKIFRRYPTRLTLAATLLTITGCEIGLHIEGLYPDEQAEGESGGDPNACLFEFDDCLSNAGEDPAAITVCHEILLGCLGEGDDGWAEGSSDGGDPPPPDDCVQLFDQCLQNDVEPELCEEEFEACNGDDWGGESSDGGESDDGGEDGCDPPSPCEDLLDACLQDNPIDPDWCFVEYEQCLGNDEPPPPPPEPCEEDLEACLQLPIDPELCFFEFDECMGNEPPPPDPCEDELNACMEDNPIDPDGCLMVFEECQGDDPAPDQCMWDFDQCLFNVLDEDDLLVCQEQFDLCLEP